MLKPHLSYIAAISVHRRTSGYPWRGGSVRSDFQCRLLYLKTYGGSREVAEDDRSLLNSWRWSLGRSKWGVKCSDPNSRISVFWTTLIYIVPTPGETVRQHKMDTRDQSRHVKLAPLPGEKRMTTLRTALQWGEAITRTRWENNLQSPNIHAHLEFIQFIQSFLYICLFVLCHVM